MKRVYLLLLCCILCFSLTGCGNKKIVATPALTLEEVAGKRLAAMTADQKADMVYKFVSDRITVDSKNLLVIPQEEVSKITLVLDSMHAGLKKGYAQSIQKEYANYLLLEFTKTPFTWEQSEIQPVGYDPASRLYFVDVVYTTTGNLKKEIPSSKLPAGAPNSDELLKARYDDYLAYLVAKQNMQPNSSDYRREFEARWGSIASVLEEQNSLSLLERTSGISGNELGKLTYSGLVNSTSLKLPAKMTMRYVLKYSYNLGEETNLYIASMYLKDFSLLDASNIMRNTLTDQVGVEVLKPFIDKMLLSYNKAVEESNDIGLYQLFKDYGALDKYYSDMRNSAIQNFGSYSYDVIGKSGTTLSVLVSRAFKIRARGSEMSLPSYDEVDIFNLELSNDDKIRISSICPVKTTIIGEPLSVIKNVSGISDLIQYSGDSFTDSNKTGVESALKAFSKVVYAGDATTANFANVVDLGVSQETMKKIADTVSAIKPSKKTTYILSWDTKTNVYVSLTLREVFETSAGNFDTESIVDLVNSSGIWKVVNYTRVLNVKTTQAIQQNGSKAFCVDTK